MSFTKGRVVNESHQIWVDQRNDKVFINYLSSFICLQLQGDLPKLGCINQILNVTLVNWTFKFIAWTINLKISNCWMLHWWPSPQTLLKCSTNKASFVFQHCSLIPAPATHVYGPEFIIFEPNKFLCRFPSFIHNLAPTSTTNFPPESRTCHTREKQQRKISIHFLIKQGHCLKISTAGLARWCAERDKKALGESTTTQLH